MQLRVKERIERELYAAQRAALQAERNIAYYTKLLDIYKKYEDQ